MTMSVARKCFLLSLFVYFVFWSPTDIHFLDTSLIIVPNGTTTTLPCYIWALKSSPMTWTSWRNVSSSKPINKQRLQLGNVSKKRQESHLLPVVMDHEFEPIFWILIVTFNYLLICSIPSQVPFVGFRNVSERESNCYPSIQESNIFGHSFSSVCLDWGNN